MKKKSWKILLPYLRSGQGFEEDTAVYSGQLELRYFTMFAEWAQVFRVHVFGTLFYAFFYLHIRKSTDDYIFFLLFFFF